ncbi:MAG: IMP dehydrogenase [Bacteroidales bacterium]
MSFITDKILDEGIDYDSVSIPPAYSKIKCEEVDISTHFSRRLGLELPFVLEVNNFQNIQLLELVSQQGGIGILGSNLDISTRLEYIRTLKKDKGKYSCKLSCVYEDTELEHIIKLVEKLPNSRIAVIDKDKTFKYFIDALGVASLSNKERPSKIEALPQKYTLEASVVKTNFSETQFKSALEKSAFIAVADDDTGNIKGYTSLAILDKYEKYPLASRSADGSLLIASKVTPTNDITRKIGLLSEAGVDAVVIEYEHPHSKWVLEELKHLKLDFSDLEILVENVSTSAGATDILLTGVDGIVVGDNTKNASRKIGVGLPLPSAIYGAFKATKHSDISLLLSGGLTNEGNIVKSLATGVDALWLNSIVNNADKCDADFLLKEMERISLNIKKGICYSGCDNLKSFKQNKFILHAGTSLLKA